MNENQTQLNNALTALKNLITDEVKPDDLRKILQGLHFRHTNIITNDESLIHVNSNNHLYWLSRVVECLDGKIED